MMTAQIFFAVFWGSQRVFFLDSRRAPGPGNHGTNNGDEKYPFKKSSLRVFPGILMYGVFEVLKCLVRTTGRGLPEHVDFNVIFLGFLSAFRIFWS